LQTIVDPKSAYTQNAAYAVGRAYDDTILAATTGPAQIGTDAASLSTETFDTTKFRVAVTFGNATTPTGLTVAKLIETKRLLRHYHNDLESDPLCLVIGSRQEADLLSQVQVVSTEFADRPVLVDGRITRFLGYDIVVMERVPETTAGSVRGVVAFVKSGMYLGLWRDIENRITIREDLSGSPWQIATMHMQGATRTQPGKVIQILCADTTGADINP
jgi:hypothetical protein